MIGSLKGKIELIDNTGLLVDVNGVGYRVHVPVSIIKRYKAEDEIKLFTYTHVREDQLELFGFADIKDMQLFTLLIGVNGVGPKIALSIFSAGEREEILSAIQNANVEFFTRVSRLGTKNAQKIIIDLKNKVGGIGSLDLSGNKTEDQELERVLKGFGFSEKEAISALEVVRDVKDSSLKIKMALKYLGK